MDVEVRVRPPKAASGSLPAARCHDAAALLRACGWLSDLACSGARWGPAWRSGARIAVWVSGNLGSVGSVGSEATESGCAEG